MNEVLTHIKLTPIGDILGYPASSVFLPREIVLLKIIKPWEVTDISATGICTKSTLV